MRVDFYHYCAHPQDRAFKTTLCALYISELNDVRNSTKPNLNRFSQIFTEVIWKLN